MKGDLAPDFTHLAHIQSKRHLKLQTQSILNKKYWKEDIYLAAILLLILVNKIQGFKL